MIVTIDGPVASGKSTVSRLLAQRLGYYYLCSGLLYRALAYLLVHNYGYTLETIANCSFEDIMQCFDQKRFSYQYDEKSKEHIVFDNNDITPFLKDEFIDKATSLVSVSSVVRNTVTLLQHTIASKYNIITDGRDVGSVVFPHAEVKFFVTASVRVRAERWCKDQEKYGNHFSLDQAIMLITDRDDRDRNRNIAPLMIPKDAIAIDTSDLTIEQTVDCMIQYVNNY